MNRPRHGASKKGPSALYALLLVGAVFAVLIAGWARFVLPDDGALSRASAVSPAPSRVVAYDFLDRLGAAVADPSLPPIVTARLGDVERRAIPAPQPSRYEFSLIVPSSATLEFWYGQSSLAAGGTRFTVDLLTEGGPAEILFSTTVAAPRRSWFRRKKTVEGSWNPAQLDLKSWQGRAVTLRFSVERPAEGEGKDAGPETASEAFWAQPLLWTPGKGTLENVVLIVLESAAWADVHGPADPSTSSRPWDRFRTEGISFQRAYANDVSSTSLRSLLHSRVEGLTLITREKGAPLKTSLVAALRAKGYRTAAIGSLVPSDGPDFGFDEVHHLKRDEKEITDAHRRALGWLADHSGDSPFFLLVTLNDLPSTGLPPARFWVRALLRDPAEARGWNRWRRRAQRVYVEEHLDNLFGGFDRLSLWDRSLTALLSTRGVEPESGRSVEFSEERIRVPWMMRSRRLPAGGSVARVAQLLDLAPTVIRLLALEDVGGFQGRALQNFEKTPEDNSRVLVHGRTGSALVFEGHYKYVRHDRAESSIDGENEEVYDLWEDPSERLDLARRRRTLLARLRRAMDEVAPARVENKLIFWDLQGKTIQGSVLCPSGSLQNVSADGELTRNGANEFYFTIQSSSGGPEVRFETWPPQAAFLLRLRLDQKTIPMSQFRFSKFGLPLSDLVGEEWYDSYKFPWMEGITRPAPGEKGPLVFIGRIPASGPPPNSSPEEAP